MIIYEIDGMRYAGADKMEIKSHPRFLSFVRLCIDNHEYSLSSDDLRRAVDGAVSRLPAPEEEAIMGNAVDLLNLLAREKAARGGRKEQEILNKQWPEMEAQPCFSDPDREV